MSLCEAFQYQALKSNAIETGKDLGGHPIVAFPKQEFSL